MPELSESELFTSGKRAEESAYVQSLVAEQKAVKELTREELAAEYTRMVAALPEQIREAKNEMARMRSEGIPDPVAYENVREGMTKAYDRFRELSQRMVDFSEELEDVYTGAMEADAETVKNGQETAKTSLELYDEEVRKLLYLAAELETNVESFAKQGMLEKLRPTIKAEMDDILSKLLELDNDSTVKGQSRERESLIDVLIHVNDLLEAPEAVAAAFSPLSESRMTYRTVKAEYAAVQHMLSEEQRRAMRLSIASLNESVRQAEDEAWSRMFGTAFSKTAAAEFEPIPPPEPPARPDIRDAIAHATEHAPAIATAALASLPTTISTPQVTERRGLLAAIGNAFRLK